ncbi:sensor histidine kinase [Leucobacter sp. HNU]|uniref:sensor histidine kinase n=1 Tax=Leucobacter sp. HNU TaxID=3236805 RepID=UPI003A803438
MARRTPAQRWADVSLRTKITGVTVFILSLGLIVAGVGTLSFLRPYLVQVVDSDLQSLSKDPTRALASGVNLRALTPYDVQGASSSYYVAMLDSTGKKRYDNATDWQTENVPRIPGGLTGTVVATRVYGSTFTITDAAGLEWRATALPINGAEPGQTGTLLIAASTAHTGQTTAQFILIFGGFGIAVILLGAALTRILVTTTFVPLAQVERTAMEISKGDFSKRIHVAHPHTEVGHLGESLNVMLDHIDVALAERARTIDQMRRFVGDAGHELRTPLVSVRGYAELYRMGALQDEEQVGQAMGRIEKEAIRMTSLVEDLLSLARLDERRPLELKTLDLNALAADAAFDALAQAPDRTISVNEDPSRPTVLGDEHKVRQLMSNLIGNALRYSPEGSPIEIAVASGPDSGHFEIIDHGEGVPEQLRTKIFDRFWRADTSRNRETGGSGLGLSIVKSIVDAHGGSVSVHETEGGGATFRVDLPVAPTTGSLEHTADRAGERAPDDPASRPDPGTDPPVGA